MDTLSLVAVAVALAMDAFAVALAAGAILHPLTFRPCFRLAFHFGLFQAMMPVLGWLAGLTVQSFVAHEGGVTGIVFAASDGGLFSCSLDKTVRSWRAVPRSLSARL